MIVGDKLLPKNAQKSLNFSRFKRKWTSGTSRISGYLELFYTRNLEAGAARGGERQVYIISWPSDLVNFEKFTEEYFYGFLL